MTKKRILIITSVLVVFITIGVFISRMPTLPEDPSKEELVSFFNENRNVFDKIANYLEGIEGEVSFDKRDGSDIESIGRIYTKNGVKPFRIGNEIKDEVEKLLYKVGFQAIYEEDHCIYFMKTGGFQWHKSLIYSKYDNTPFLNRTRDFEKLDKGWYYYYGE
ncbi:hypothetical protein [Tepidibacillus marianensis]|uniref:hypothetical protein n=1 Tax=Tepidibacillus marianensis TaxID=3131995 RepID=UPI0030CC0156